MWLWGLLSFAGIPANIFRKTVGTPHWSHNLRTCVCAMVLSHPLWLWTTWGVIGSFKLTASFMSSSWRHKASHSREPITANCHGNLKATNVLLCDWALFWLGIGSWLLIVDAPSSSPVCSGKPPWEILLSLILGFPIMTLEVETSEEFIPEAVKGRHRESSLFTPATTRAVLLFLCLMYRDSASERLHILHFDSI